ncbi:hypothetical protein N7532_001043 [Penicillium argentinense]|uniref:Uncharacterized protein n=1 Tax=Penicillium argentinense TaxID=1131581 RepID=A0A9W9G205_9EURO|nr:uncharacterized protein N7532_001043 [Penicillium argentinense]KAJ5110508.1 hypothetical protein N7532_001043 [Penicillium argentinense]
MDEQEILEMSFQSEFQDSEKMKSQGKTPPVSPFKSHTNIFLDPPPLNTSPAPHTESKAFAAPAPETVDADTLPAPSLETTLGRPTKPLKNFSQPLIL